MTTCILENKVNALFYYLYKSISNLYKEVFKFINLYIFDTLWHKMEWLVTNLIDIFNLRFFYTELIELIFFRVASRALCFGFVLKTALITQGCFSYFWSEYTQSQGIFCLSHHSASEEALDAQESGRGQSQDTWPQLTKGIFHNIWCHAQHISWWKKEEGGMMIFSVTEFVSSSDRYMWWNCFPRNGWTPACQWEAVT